jgi:hypothetical protein
MRDCGRFLVPEKQIAEARGDKMAGWLPKSLPTALLIAGISLIVLGLSGSPVSAASSQDNPLLQPDTETAEITDTPGDSPTDTRTPTPQNT